MPSLATIFWLGVKELRSLRSDVVLIALVAYAFTVSIYTQARGTSSEVNNASIAFVDEDQSQLSQHLASCFYPPRFKPPGTLRAGEVDRAMSEGRYMFVVVIPPRFEADLRAGRRTEVQVNIDATAMYQASNGASYIQSILNDEMSRYLVRSDAKFQGPMRLVIRKAFNPNGDTSWFNGIVAIINQITLLTVILTGAALIREREHGTLEHLMVMPLTAFEIAIAKVWANGLVAPLGPRATYGALARYAFDVGDWEKSRWSVFLGASGHPASPFYANQHAAWASCSMTPMRYGWAGIAAGAVATQRLLA